MELYKITKETIDEIIKRRPIQSDVQTKETPNKLRDQLYKLIKGEEGTIDGKQLRDFVFPIDEFDVFISHSHNDKEIAHRFATWFEEKYELRVFLDSFIWQSADGLLRAIDDKYCRYGDGKYDYKRRNYSTAHVHTMLSMSIFEIIKKSKVGIFIDSPHSIQLSNLKNTNKVKTLSPWIYQEIMFMRQFAEEGAETRMFSSQDSKLNENFEITHPVDLSDFTPLTAEMLLKKIIM